MIAAHLFLGPVLVLGIGQPPLPGRPAVREEREIVDQEQVLKAGWLKFFAEFVTWPEIGPDVDPATFVIGVLGPNPYGQHLTDLGKRKAGDRRIVVRSFASLEELEPCHILLVSPLAAPDLPEPSAPIRLERALAWLEAAPVLVVSDHPGAALSGSMVNYDVDPETNLIHLEFNLAAVKRGGLTVSSRLLSLKTVRIVKRPEEGR